MNCWQWKNEVGVHVWLGLTSTPTERPYSGTRNTKITYWISTILCLDCVFLIMLRKGKIQCNNYVMKWVLLTRILVWKETTSRISQELISEWSLFSALLIALCKSQSDLLTVKFKDTVKRDEDDNVIYKELHDLVHRSKFIWNRIW